MPFNLNVKSVSLLFIVVHLAAIAFVLLYKGVREDRWSSKCLGFLLILSGLHIFPFMAGYAGWYSVDATRTVLFYVPFQHPLLIAPLLFVYFRSLTDEHFEFNREHAVHLVPGLMYIGYSLAMAVNDIVLDNSFQFYGDGKDRDFDFWHQAAGFISLATYAVLSLQLYRNYVGTIKDTLSYADEVMLRWARTFVISFMILLMLRLIFFITNPEWDNFGKKFWYYASFGGVMYYLSLNGLAHAIRLESSMRPQRIEEHQQSPLEPKMQDTPDAESRIIKEKISAVLHDKQSYRNPKLTVADLAKDVGVQGKRLSQTINYEFKMNFNDLINLYRINDVKARIDRGDLKNRTILGLAEEAGFNSKTTFNRVFKKIMNLSPKEYASRAQERGAKSGSGATSTPAEQTFAEKT